MFKTWPHALIMLYIHLVINVTFSFKNQTRLIEIVWCVCMWWCGGLVVHHVWITLSVLISFHHCYFVSIHNFSIWSPILFCCVSLSLFHPFIRIQCVLRIVFYLINSISCSYSINDDDQKSLDNVNSFSRCCIMQVYLSMIGSLFFLFLKLFVISFLSS